MPSPLLSARDAIKALFVANFAGDEPVLYGDNNATDYLTPDVAAWLHIDIEPGYEQIAAFGGGPRLADRSMTGIVDVTAAVLRGEGETTLLTLLDAAVDALRGRQSDGLTLHHTIRYSASTPSEDGLWVWRNAMLSFEYRFQG